METINRTDDPIIDGALGSFRGLGCHRRLHSSTLYLLVKWDVLKQLIRTVPVASMLLHMTSPRFPFPFGGLRRPSARPTLDDHDLQRRTRITALVQTGSLVQTGRPTQTGRREDPRCQGMAN